MRTRLRYGLFLLAGGLVLPAMAESDRGRVLAPVPYQVIQRQGFDPERAHANAPGGPALGHGLVPIVVECPDPGGARIEFRVVMLRDSFGHGTEWAPLGAREAGGRLTSTAEVPAGGWYRLELREVSDGRVQVLATVEPFGVGEVFLIAGQSYAAGANDAHTRVDDPEGRVVAYDVANRSWRVAHDPQPARGEGGTIWPPMGNALLPMARVPIGFVNVASGGTASRQWLPGTPLFEAFAAAGKEIGPFRAVLWQQGESDVIEKVSTATYVENLVAIRSGLAREFGFDPPWLLAKSTMHPTVYNNPAGEGQIRAAIDQMYTLPGFRRGPDTDILGGENRGGRGTRRHFTEIGQRRAGLLWFAAAWDELMEHPNLNATARPELRQPHGGDTSP